MGVVPFESPFAVAGRRARAVRMPAAALAENFSASGGLSGRNLEPPSQWHRTLAVTGRGAS